MIMNATLTAMSRTAIMALAVAAVAIAATVSTPGTAAPLKTSLEACDPSPNSCSYSK
jgi:hypothetical protein